MPIETRSRTNYLNELTHLLPRLPNVIQQDIFIRVGNWLQSGGSPYDGYIAQQVRYAVNVIEGAENEINAAQKPV